ncbi:hypothetical protein PXK28_20950 [Phaeobacter gallaeciensis]|uniref:hypothetical protein n=1 Tax=Phaeobacter gallaeciensis TaxID=60890 RepID=UPI00237F3DEB|nr:hypothetical protein [Phaeobacter gallaeciensis]MDE4408389.1 hypothetical protein [Phaeobacter gallaeciensis]
MKPLGRSFLFAVGFKDTEFLFKLIAIHILWGDSRSACLLGIAFVPGSSRARSIGLSLAPAPTAVGRPHEKAM